MTRPRFFHHALILVCAILPAWAGVLDDLPEAMRSGVEAGEQVMLEEEVEDMPWPRVHIYQTVDASPEQVAAVFTNYGNARNFIPNVIESTIDREVSPCVNEVSYTVDVPLFPDESYTVRNALARDPEGGLSVSWDLLRARSTRHAAGKLTIQPLGDGRSALRYSNLVDPGSAIARLLRSIAPDRMRQTVDAIVAETTRMKNEEPGALEESVRNLREKLDNAGN